MKRIASICMALITAASLRLCGSDGELLVVNSSNVTAGTILVHAALAGKDAVLSCFDGQPFCHSVQAGDYLMVRATAGSDGSIYNDCTNVILYRNRSGATTEKVGVYCWAKSKECYMTTCTSEVVAPITSEVPVSVPTAITATAAPSAPSKRTPRVEVLSKRANKEGGDRLLIIRLWNDSSNPLTLPRPLERCGSDDGYVDIRMRVLREGKGPITPGVGCAADRLLPRDVLLEAKNWLTIAPHASYEITSTVTLRSGEKIELWAVYHSPRLNDSEFAILEQHGIYTPNANAVSAPIVVARKSNK